MHHLRCLGLGSLCQVVQIVARIYPGAWGGCGGGGGVGGAGADPYRVGGGGGKKGFGRGEGQEILRWDNGWHEVPPRRYGGGSQLRPRRKGGLVGIPPKRSVEKDRVQAQRDLALPRFKKSDDRATPKTRPWPGALSSPASPSSVDGGNGIRSPSPCVVVGRLRGGRNSTRL